MCPRKFLHKPPNGTPFPVIEAALAEIKWISFFFAALYTPSEISCTHSGLCTKSFFAPLSFHSGQLKIARWLSVLPSLPNIYCLTVCFLWIYTSISSCLCLAQTHIKSLVWMHNKREESGSRRVRRQRHLCRSPAWFVATKAEFWSQKHCRFQTLSNLFLKCKSWTINKSHVSTLKPTVMPFILVIWLQSKAGLHF